MLGVNNNIDDKPCESFSCYFRISCNEYNERLFNKADYWLEYENNRKKCNGCNFNKCTYCNKNHCICNS